MATRTETLKYIFKEISLSANEIKEIFAQGLTNPVSIVSAIDKGKIFLLENKNISFGTLCVLEQLGLYLKWYRRNHQDFTDLRNYFTNKDFETFDPELLEFESQATTEKRSKDKEDATIERELEEKTKINLKMSDYPRFTGKKVDWPTFETKFTAACELQGLADLLDREDSKHDEKFVNDPTYKRQCEILYSLLKNSCAGGMALSKVKAFQKTKNGHKAWIDLYNKYWAESDPNQFYATCLTKLLNLRLTPHSPGGVAKYLSEREAIELQCEELGHPIEEVFGKTCFLDGIHDRKYQHYKTTARSEKMSYEKAKALLETTESDFIKQDKDARLGRSINNYVSKFNNLVRQVA